MSLVSSRLALVHSCTVERDVASGGWGDEQTPDWQPHLTGLPCRLWVTAGRETVDRGISVVAVEDLRMLVAAGTDVTERDRVTNVTWRGATVAAGPLQVRAVLYRPDHLELVLVRLA